MKTLILILALFVGLHTSCISFTPENPVEYEQQLRTVVDSVHLATLAALVAVPDQVEKLEFAITVFNTFLVTNTEYNQEALRYVSNALAESRGWDKDVAYLAIGAAYLAVQQVEIDKHWKNVTAAVIVGIQRAINEQHQFDR